MINAETIVKKILQDRTLDPGPCSAEAFSPTNIALVKYWGKRNTVLNLPMTSSFSVSLGDLGTQTKISLSETDQDAFILNDKIIPEHDAFSQKIIDYLTLICSNHRPYLKIETISHLPVAAGFASSASGFAALISALNQLGQWELTLTELSILARLGSGSACRSLWPGFVKWERGKREDGMDSHGVPYAQTWPQLRIGLLVISAHKKSVSSREAMQRTVETSSLYQAWPRQVEHDLEHIIDALHQKNFHALGTLAEHNALTMHATLLASWPPVFYWQTQTLLAAQKIWQLRQEGLPLYFTQDAGPNLKLLYLQQDSETVRSLFPDVQEITPFS